jgi:hypothetical protein
MNRDDLAHFKGEGVDENVQRLERDNDSHSRARRRSQSSKLAMNDVPDYYLPNSRLSLHFPQCDLLVIVVRAFTPFTMQQVLLVQTLQDYPSIPSGSYVISKVYDPRFYTHRFKYEPYLLWSYSSEVKAAEKRPSQPIAEFQPWIWPDEGDSVGWEEWYYQNAELAFHSESEAYRLLAPLQGTRIPRCFGTGTLTPPEPRAITPRVLLLKYLPDAKRLADVDPSSITPSLVKSLIETARAFGPLGVVHTDFNPGNILFIPGDSPSRAVIIDFGSAGVREEGCSDEEWEAIVAENDDVHWIEVRLKQELGLEDLADYLASGCSATPL